MCDDFLLVVEEEHLFLQIHLLEEHCFLAAVLHDPALVELDAFQVEIEFVVVVLVVQDRLKRRLLQRLIKAPHLTVVKTLKLDSWTYTFHQL